MNEYRMKFSGAQIELPKALGLGDEVVYQGNGEVVTENRKNNQDGSHILISTVRPVFLDIKAMSQGSSIPKLETKTISGSKSLSKKQREKWYLIYEQQYTGQYPDFNSFYESVMERIGHLQSLILDGDLTMRSLLRYD